MKIFVLNRGSSSIKCYLYECKSAPSHLVDPVWEAHIQWKNHFDDPLVNIKDRNKEYETPIREKTLKEAFKYVLSLLLEGVLGSFDEIDIVGHRIVHGGSDFKESTFVTPEVKEKIRKFTDLAPLHILPELEGIEIFEEVCKGIPQLVVFDTAFHHTILKQAQVYPGPYHWYEEGIQRYGFHGISYQYCSRRAAEILNKDQKKLRMVICHLGAGASLCAIKNGVSVDTTMGFTPLEGIMMNTRSGTIDPGILLYLLERHKDGKELSKILYKESGLLGVSGFSSDMRDIIKESLKGSERASLAWEVYLHRLNGMIGSMIASLQGIDVLVFTAGIGENTPLLREKVGEAFSFLGMKIDETKNQESLGDRQISTSDSKPKVLVIHTQEAFEIARECYFKKSNLRNK